MLSTAEALANIYFNIFNVLVNSSVVSIGGAQSRLPASPISTGIADKVILGKEISKSVRCFQKTRTFRVYDLSLV